MADDSVIARILAALKSEYGTAGLIDNMQGPKTLPTPPVSVAAAPPPLPPYQAPQGVAAYQPAFNPQGAPQAPVPGGMPGIPPPPPGMPPLGAPPAQWMALGDQNRTAAFDPTKDMNDPRNVRSVDINGAVLPNGLQYGV
jgi:hypothetical protein